eukprot:ANDGO_04192.mRNA.6 O-phosphoseryl-tRNA(Sec) selenium transferase
MDDPEIAKLASSLIPRSFVQTGADALSYRHSVLKTLLSQRRIPEHGVDELTIEWIVNELAGMDSNNHKNSVGAGEREGRVICPLVQKRNLYLSHGIGRSGDLLSSQPKAPGSSLLNVLTNKYAFILSFFLHQTPQRQTGSHRTIQKFRSSKRFKRFKTKTKTKKRETEISTNCLRSMVLDLIKTSGVKACKEAIVVPCATGMTLSLCFLTLMAERKQAKYVVWSRIDQKTCVKCMLTAGVEPIVVEPVLHGDSLVTNVQGIEDAIYSAGKDNVLCVFATTSCFAPRTPDKVIPISHICKRLDVPFIINNAYGVYLKKCMAHIQEACHSGRVDAFVQSTDKNLCVPVGGAILASPNAAFVQKAAQLYPGRASAAPTLDTFLTLLHLGRSGWAALVSQQERNFGKLKLQLQQFAAKVGERVLSTDTNPVSLAMTLANIDISQKSLGGMLLSRHVSGARMNVTTGNQSKIGTVSFRNFGQHSDAYPAHAYLNIACGIGMQEPEIQALMDTLANCYAILADQRRSGSASDEDVATKL